MRTQGVPIAARRLGRRAACAIGLAAAAVRPAAAATASRFFTASDGTRLHYLHAGPAGRRAAPARTIVLVPGWTMPAWIFTPQIQAFAPKYQVIAFDPRAQGESEIARAGYDHLRRSQDILELLAHIGSEPVVLIAWSLAVLEALALVKTHGQDRLAGLVLVDNSIGEDPPPPAAPPAKGPKPPHDLAMRRFVGGMFHQPQSRAYLERLSQATLRVPEPVTRALLSYPVPRSYWKEAVYAVSRPLLYIVRPKFAGQARNLVLNHPSAEAVTLGNEVGHALFVDDPARFNFMVMDFIRRKVWP